MAILKIARGRAEVQIDEEDIPLVAGYKWRLYKVKGLLYAVTGRQVLMHRLIMSAPDGVFVDHQNRDGLDNRRSVNLRFCTNAQNMMNITKTEGRTSQFKGVSWHKHSQKWCAAIQKSGKSVHLGAFTEEERAARQYDRAARLMFGQFARTNEMMGLIS